MNYNYVGGNIQIVFEGLGVRDLGLVFRDLGLGIWG
jgi:hypothetical protein